MSHFLVSYTHLPPWKNIGNSPVQGEKHNCLGVDAALDPTATVIAVGVELQPIDLGLGAELMGTATAELVAPALGAGWLSDSNVPGRTGCPMSRRKGLTTTPISSGHPTLRVMRASLRSWRRPGASWQKGLLGECRTPPGWLPGDSSPSPKSQPRGHPNWTR